MKIIHIVTIGNTLPFLKEHVAHLRSKGHEVVAVSAAGSVLERFGDEMGIRAVGIEMKRRISPISDLVAVFQLWTFLMRERPEVVHTHTPKAGLLGTAAAWLARVPVKIFHIHGLPYLGGHGLTTKLLKVATRWSCKLADRVWCVSPSVRQQAIEDHLIDENCIEVLGSGSIGGVDALRRFVPSVKEKQTSEFRILFAGRLAIDKGIREVRDAWLQVRSQLPGSRLVLAGEVDERDAAPIGLINELRADARVDFKGWVEDMVSEYELASLVWLPTYREGLGMVLLEAAAMQVPAVSSDVPGCRDAIIHGATGQLVPPKDIDALVKATLEYANNPELARKHGENGRERVLRHFAMLPILEQAEEGYNTLLQDYRNTKSCKSWAKRLIDVTGAIVALVALGPLLGVAAILVRFSMGSPVLFRQFRPGLHGKPFEILKLRTMSQSIDSNGNPLADRDRLSRLGAWLRQTSIDELPELWNVLRGDMSLVGPRPLLPRYSPYFSELERARFHAKPGITGWAQIHGRNYSPWSERLANDVWYVANWSVWLDLRILFGTVIQVFAQRDIAVDANAVMQDLNVERAGSINASPDERLHSTRRSS